MAFRRKSAKPVNKLRHQVIEEDDNDDNTDDDGEQESDIKINGNNDNTLSRLLPTQDLENTEKDPLLQVSNQSKMVTLRKTVAIGRETASSAPFSAVYPANADISNIIQPQSQKLIGQVVLNPAPLSKAHPFLAVPSDIYQDFENLKSATRLDTSELMRKLLQDYTRLTEGHLHQRSQPGLDDLNGLTTNMVSLASPQEPHCDSSNSSEILDLSTNAFNLPRNVQLAFTDDQMAMNNANVWNKTLFPDSAVNGIGPTHSDTSVEEEVAPLDLSLGSKHTGAVSSPCTDYASLANTNFLCNLDSSNDQHRFFRRQQHDMYTTGAVFALPPDANQIMSPFVKQDTERDSPIIFTSTSPSFLSTSEGSTSNGPAKSYVINLEPSKSPKLSLSTSQWEQHTDASHQFANGSKYVYDFPAQSKLFSSFPLSKKHEQPCLVLKSETEQDLLNRSNVPRTQIAHSFESPGGTIDIKKSQWALDKNYDIVLQKKASTLPTYSEAISSIVPTKPQHINQEVYPSTSRNDGDKPVMPTHFLSPDNVKLLHSDHQIDVRFVPYASLAKLASPQDKESGIDSQQSQHMLLQKILEHQSNLFAEPQHYSGERNEFKSKTSPLNDQRDLMLVSHNEKLTTADKSSVQITHTSAEARICSVANNPLTDEAKTHIVARSFPSKDSASVSNPQVSSSNVLIDSQTVIFTQKTEGENSPGAVRVTQEESIVPDGPSAALPGLPAAYLMAQAGPLNDNLGGMLAIPVINGGNLPSVLTGLQPFAFAPNTLVSPTFCNGILPSETNKAKRQSEGCGSAALRYKAETYRPTNTKSPKLGMKSEVSLPDSDPLQTHSENIGLLQGVYNTMTNDQQNSSFSVSIAQRDMLSPSTRSSDLKPKAGRPRGRGGRNGGKGAVCKEMKLLTENTLFPGVYTSILKLPWSRRSRNKAKAKTVSQMRKEAQAIALAQEKHEKSLEGKLLDNFLPEMSSNHDLNTDTENEHLIVSDNSSRTGIGNQGQDKVIGMRTDFQKQHLTGVETIEAAQKGMMHFPQLDEVLRQSYAMQKNLQRKENEKPGKVEKNQVNPLLEDGSDFNGFKSNLFQNVGTFLRPDLNASQIQRTSDSSPVFPLKINTLSTAETDEVSTSIERDHAKPQCSVPCDQKDSSPSLSASQTPTLSNFFDSGQLPSYLRRNKKPISTAFESDNIEHHSHSGRFRKPIASKDASVDAIRNVTNGENKITSSSPSTLIRTSSRFTLAGGTCAASNSATSNLEFSEFGSSFNANTQVDEMRLGKKIKEDAEEMSLEKKINLLTQQIGLEMSQSLMDLSKTAQRENCNAKLEFKDAKPEIAKDSENHKGPVSENAGFPFDPEVRNSASTIAGILNQPRSDARLLGIKGFAKLRRAGVADEITLSTLDMIGPGVSSTNTKEFSGTTTSSAVSVLNQKAVEKSATHKTIVASTPRRKKVSRLLKSDENFMYATFKIKPKGGLTPRKSRRKRKASEITRDRSADAEINKKVPINIAPSAETAGLENTSSSTILWKFHEQYATTDAEAGYEIGHIQSSLTPAHERCGTCGKVNSLPGIIVHGEQTCRCLESASPLQQQFSLETDNFPFPDKISETHSNSLLSGINGLDLGLISTSKTSLANDFNSGESIHTTDIAKEEQEMVQPREAVHPDVISVSCMTCGKLFHKFYCDPRCSCDGCLRTVPRVISSSKLFSLSDAPSETLPFLTSSTSSSYSCAFVSTTSPANATTSLKKFLESKNPSSAIVSTSSSLSSSLFSVLPLSPPLTTTEKSASVDPPTLISSDAVCTESRSLKPTLPSKPIMDKADHLKQDGSSYSSHIVSSVNALDMSLNVLQSPITSVSYIPLPPPGVSVLTSSSKSSIPSAEPQINNVKVSGNNLYCGLCRMKFAKICDYLLHVRQLHDKPKKTLGSGILYSFVPSKYNTGNSASSTSAPKRPKRLSKTKKSLAHKTLTCPVEDCPYFFREKNEIISHFLTKHPLLILCPHRNCTFVCKERGDLQNHISSTHDRNHGNCDQLAGEKLNGVEFKANDMVESGQDDEKDTNRSESACHNTSEVSHFLNPNGLSPNLTSANNERFESETKGSEELDVNSVTFVDFAESSDQRGDQSISEKPLKCEFCDYRCRQKNALSWHMRKHPEAAGQYRKYSVKSEG